MEFLAGHQQACIYIYSPVLCQDSHGWHKDAYEVLAKFLVIKKDNMKKERRKRDDV